MDKKRKNVIIILGILMIALLFGMYAYKKDNLLETGKMNRIGDGQIVVIDAGHGGMDPGKVAVNGKLEKDINLEIAKKVKKYLELNDIKVVMTREKDEGLYQLTDSNKKVVDMKNRLRIIEENHPLLTVSIHQNSYPNETVSGMQVFYYRDSLCGKEAAEIMQKQLIESLKPEKERAIKDNTTYYLLKKTSVPIMIVECGFLSNKAEAELLCNPEYQEKIAWAIHMGILRYINDKK